MARRNAATSKRAKRQQLSLLGAVEVALRYSSIRDTPVQVGRVSVPERHRNATCHNMTQTLCTNSSVKLSPSCR